MQWNFGGSALVIAQDHAVDAGPRSGIGDRQAQRKTTAPCLATLILRTSANRKY
jgi:hypothetical protein